MSKANPIIITTQAAWQQAAEVLSRSASLAVDLEGNGFFRYPERICLVQLGAEGHVFLLDPLAVSDLSLLKDLLADEKVEKIFHSCDWDLRILRRDFGFQVRNIFDTSIAARFLGLNQAGLGNVLKTFLSVELNKSKALQRQDWTLRPLPPESVDYAADDVFYLQRLRDLLAADLQKLDRRPWVQEEFLRLESLRFSVPVPPEEGFWNMKGARTLSPRQRGVLRELYLFRDEIARRQDRPPFKVVSDSILLDLAVKPDSELSQIKGLNYLLHLGRLDSLREVIKRGVKQPGIPLPKPVKEPPIRMGEEAKSRFTALKVWRQAKGTALNLDPSLLWPMRSLEAIDVVPERRRLEFLRENGSEVRAWQGRMFGEELEQLCAELDRDASPLLLSPNSAEPAPEIV